MVPRVMVMFYAAGGYLFHWGRDLTEIAVCDFILLLSPYLGIQATYHSISLFDDLGRSGPIWKLICGTAPDDDSFLSPESSKATYQFLAIQSSKATSE